MHNTALQVLAIAQTVARQAAAAARASGDQPAAERGLARVAELAAAAKVLERDASANLTSDLRPLPLGDRHE
jgi:hypothetical protein